MTGSPERGTLLAMGAVGWEMATRASAAGLLVGIAALGCSSGQLSVGDDRQPVIVFDSSGATDVPDVGADAVDDAVDAASGFDAIDATDAGSAIAGSLVALTATCSNRISHGLLQSQPGRTADVAICGLSSAVFWKSGLAVLCAGKSTAICNDVADPQFQASTTGKDSHGDSLDAAAVPYVEVSAKSMIFDYSVDAGLKMGTVMAVIYKDRLQFGVIGTVGVQDVIGDASYAMANDLGMNPNPSSGGTPTGVTYIAFPAAVVTMLENNDEAVQLGLAAADALIKAGK